MPSWIRINEKGLTTCALCACSVVQIGFIFICTNLTCEKHYDAPAEQYYNPNPIESRYSVTVTGTAYYSSTSTSTTTLSTTTTTLPVDRG